MVAAAANTDTVFQPREAELDYLLLDAVTAGLQRSGYRALSNLKCEVLSGEVVITGVVPSYFLKQIAQNIILRIGHVKGMKNHLEVAQA
jgi:hypothetical protein